jgi:UDPglucose 6-dehydrogenase
MKIAIVGAGAVGNAMKGLFRDIVLYDEPKGLGTRDDLSSADLAFICVPTPSAEDGSCDTSIVEEVVQWLQTPVICIRSTVSVGTTRALGKKYGKALVFQPEYGPGETPDHPFNDLRKVRWIILGGERRAARVVARAWKDVYSSDITIRYTDPETAELCKYMENAFLAMKVTFCNELYEIAEHLGVDYDELRELWLLDPRVGRSHTFVLDEKRGYGGKCLPKDLDALIRVSERASYDPRFLRAVVDSNARIRALSARPSVR